MEEEKKEYDFFEALEMIGEQYPNLFENINDPAGKIIELRDEQDERKI